MGLTGEWWIAVGTIWLAVATTGLWGFTAALWWTTSKAVSDSKEAINVSRRAAKAAKRSAGTASKAYQNLERPYLFVSIADRPKTASANNPTMMVQYAVKNYGRTPAIIENIRAGISQTSFLPEDPMRADEDNPLLRNPVLGSHEERNELRQQAPDGLPAPVLDGSHPDGGEYVIPDTANGTDFFFWIIINYRGAFTKGHETSACWRYYGPTRSLVQYGHQDYNYTR